MKISFTGINKLDEQNKVEIKDLARELALRIALKGDKPTAMRVQLKEVPVNKHSDKSKRELEMKLFFAEGPMFLVNPEAVDMLKAKGFAPFTHGFVKYFKQHGGK